MPDLIIENGIIVDILPHDDALHAGAVVDAGDETVMPGFIETRTHLDPTFGEVLGRIWLGKNANVSGTPPVTAST